MRRRQSTLEVGQVCIPRRGIFSRGTPPRGLELEGANLAGCDLRGLDLSHANLRSADLRGARIGLTTARSVVLVASSLLASVAFGLLAGVAGHELGALMRGTDPLGRMVGRVVAVQLAMSLLLSVWRGLDVALRYLVLPSSIVAVVLSVVGTTMGRSGIGGIAILSFIVLLWAILCVATLSRAVAGSVGGFLFAVVAMSGSLAGKMAGGGVVAFALALVALLLGKRALRDSGRMPLLASTIRKLVCLGATSFRGADLRGARLEGAIIRCADLRGAVYDDVSLSGARLSMCERDDPPRLASHEGSFKSGPEPSGRPDGSTRP